eukprot:4664311-Pleurochrysis_carterae.AAC.3
MASARSLARHEQHPPSSSSESRRRGALKSCRGAILSRGPRKRHHFQQQAFGGEIHTRGVPQSAEKARTAEDCWRA